VETLDLSGQFGGVFRGRRVLVTGHTGFKGSWLCLWLQALGAEVGGLALDPDTTPSHWALLDPRLAFDARIDLRDRERVDAALADFRPQVVIHLAAQAIVRRSYREPVATFESNVIGLVHLLEAVRACPSVEAMVNATTDKVYETRPTAAGYGESDPLGGHDPYSTSKACAELISACYAKSYFEPGDAHGRRVRTATARAGNVIGGGDWAQDRLIPDLVRSLRDATPVKIRNPVATRPWQHVLEPLSGYLRLAQMLIADPAAQGAWNFGPAAANSLSVGDAVGLMQRQWPRLRVELDRGPHPYEAPLLALDSSKARAVLGWMPVWDAERAFARTAGWYRGFLEHGEVGSADDLAAYSADARQAGMAWA
jgi:CDP-glucose 4,6-dehydratase